MRLLRLGFAALGILPLLAAAALAADAPADPSQFTVAAAGPVPATAKAAAPVLKRSMPTTAYEPQHVSFADGVTGQFTVTYAVLPGFRPLTLDLYQPAARPTPMPLVVFVHGGDWDGGDARHAGTFDDFPVQLAALAAQGYVVASINYRLSEEARFPGPLQDVKTAIRWLRAHAAENNIDTTRVAVWGASGGGQLAALAGVTCGVGRFEPDGEANATDLPSDCVQAVIDWYGASDLQTLQADNGKPAAQNASFASGTSSSEGGYLGCEPATCPPGLAKLASPIAFISATTPPFLIQHGAADTTVSPKQSKKLYDALKAAGSPAEFILYPNVAHEFAKDGNPDPATNAQAMAKLVSFLGTVFPSTPVASREPPQIRRDSLN